MIETAKSPGWLPRDRRWLWLFGGLATIVGVVAVMAALAITLLDEDWLKQQLVAKAREIFEIELEIDSLQFQPWQGKADLDGVAFRIEKPDQHIHGKIESVHAELAIWPLLFRDVDVLNLRITEPQVAFVLDCPPEPQQRPALDQAAENIVAVQENLLVRILRSLLEALHPKQGYDISIARLEMAGGKVDCTVHRPGVEPVEVVFDNVAYAASDLRPSQPGFGTWGYIAHADMSADLSIGDARIGLQHQFASLPRTIKITGLDLAEVDRLGSQKDAIVFKDGTLDLVYHDKGDQFEVDAQFTAMKLEKNDEADLPDVFFVPVDHLIAYVEENDGNLALRFSHDRQETVLSNDLEFLIAEAWRGMWAELLKRFQGEAAETLEDWKAKGTEKLRNFLRNKDFLN